MILCICFGAGGLLTESRYAYSVADILGGKLVRSKLQFTILFLQLSPAQPNISMRNY